MNLFNIQNIKSISLGLLALLGAPAMAASTASASGPDLVCCAKPPAEFGSMTWRFNLASLGTWQSQVEGTTYVSNNYSALAAGTGFERPVNGGIVPGNIAMELDITQSSKDVASAGPFGSVSHVGSFGGVRFYDARKAYPALAGYEIPYMTITNFDVNLLDRTVTADLGTNRGVQSRVKLFSYDTFAYLNDPTADMAQGTMVSIQTSPLTLTAEGRTALTQLFQFDGSEAALSQGLGTLTITTASAVPEVSSLAMMAVGMALVGGVRLARRRTGRSQA
jgi:hypothetical protein